MKTTLRATFALLLGLSCTMAVAADLPKPGLYKMTGKTSSEQLPIRRTNTSEQYIEEGSFADNPKSWMSNQRDQTCEVKRYDVADGTINMKMQCEVDRGGSASIVGTGTYTGSSFEMTNVIKMNMGGMAMEMRTEVSGERQGDC